ncbi:MAG: sorbosone dehydrogenase family protein, partial [Acidobacteriota bacterium]
MRSYRYAVCALSVAALAGCGEMAQLPPGADVGVAPTLPAPETSPLPTVGIAPAKGWSADGKPVPSSGLTVARFAGGLEHPRSVYVLPNGDVLV